MSITILRQVRKLEQASDVLWSNAAAQTGNTCSLRQVIVLDAIDRANRAGKAPSQTLIVTETGIDRSTLADVTRRLVRNGMIKRYRRADDCRTYAIEVTELGMVELKAGRRAAVKAASTLNRHVDGLAGIALGENLPGPSSAIVKSRKQVAAAGTQE